MFLWTFFLFWQPWRKTFVNFPETSLLSWKPWSFEQFLSETLLCKCSSGHIEFIFDIPVHFCTVNSKFFLVNVQNWWQVCYPKTFFRNFFRTDTYATVSTNVPLFFHKKSKFFCSKSEQLKKKQFFKVKFPQMFPLNTCIAVLAHLDSFICHGTKKLLQIQISNKKHSFSGKRIDFPQNFPVDARMTFVTTLKEIFRKKLLFFFLKFQRILKQCAKFQTCFFPQSLPRLRRLQFWQLWRTFPTEWTWRVRSES